MKKTMTTTMTIIPFPHYLDAESGVWDGTATLPWLLGSDLPSVRSFSDILGTMSLNIYLTKIFQKKSIKQVWNIQSYNALPIHREKPPHLTSDFRLFLELLSDGGCVKKRGITNQLFLEISYLLQNEYVYIYIMFNEQYHILVNGESYFSNIIGKHIWYSIGFEGTLCSNNPHGNAKWIWTCGNPLDCEISIRGSQCQPLLNSTCDEGRQFWAPFVLGNPINQYMSTCSKNQTLKWFPLPISIKWNLNRPVLHTMLQCYMYMMLSPHHFAPWLSRSRGATLLGSFIIW